MKKKARIKICGMRESANIEDIAALNPDFIGFIFYPDSPRFAGERLNPAQLKNFNPQVKKVGVFVDQALDEISARIEQYKLDLVQLHGAETPEFCAELAAKFPLTALIKAFGVDESFDFAQTKAFEDHCRLFLFDTKCAGHGGSGESFSWPLLAAYRGERPYLLSGGIGTHNIAAALAHVREHERAIGIDLNSKIERAVGVKAVQLVYQIINEAQHEVSS